MIRIVIALTLIVLPVIPLRAQEAELYGTYALIKTTQKLVDTGQEEEFRGEKGFITYTKEGRMFVLIVRGDRPKPESLDKMTDQQRADLFRSLTAYTGTYKFDGKTILHNIDISWNEVWTGTSQVRHFSRDGDKIILTTNPIPRPTDGKRAVTTLAWQRVP
jgi:hypothetical protein